MSGTEERRAMSRALEIQWRRILQKYSFRVDMFTNQELLRNEEEFLRLNSEIDLKTRDLMDQVNEVLKHQESDQNDVYSKRTFPKEDDSKASNPTEPEGKGGSNTFGPSDLSQIWCGSDSEGKNSIRDDDVVEIPEGTRRRSLKGSHSANADNMALPQGILFPGKLLRHKSDIKLKEKFADDILPESLKGMGQDNIIRFLKAKVKVLAEQLEIIHGDEKKHIEKIKELQTDRERVAEDRDKWIQQANIAKNVLIKHEQHASNIVVQMQNIQAENGHLKREVDKLKKELKQIMLNSGSNEVRLNRSIEEVEKLKNSLKQAKQQEKDLRESHRKKTEELSGAVKRLDKQRIELLHAFKKQLVIIDNLKKQKGLVEAGKFVKSVEDDFMEFLDWNPGNI